MSYSREYTAYMRTLDYLVARRIAELGQGPWGTANLAAVRAMVPAGRRDLHLSIEAAFRTIEKQRVLGRMRR